MEVQELSYTCILTAFAEAFLAYWWFAHHRKDGWSRYKLIHSLLGLSFSIVCFALALAYHDYWPVVLWFWLLVFTGWGDTGFLIYKLWQSKNKPVEVSSATHASSNRRWFGQCQLWRGKPSPSRRFPWPKKSHLAGTWKQPNVDLGVRPARPEISPVLPTSFYGQVPGPIPSRVSKTSSTRLIALSAPPSRHGSLWSTSSADNDSGCARSIPPTRYRAHNYNTYQVVFVGPNAEKKKQLARLVLGYPDEADFQDNEPLKISVNGKTSTLRIIYNAEASMDSSNWEEIKRKADMFIVVFDEADPNYKAICEEARAIDKRPTMLVSFKIDEKPPLEVQVRTLESNIFGLRQGWLEHRIKGPNYEVEAESMIKSLVREKMKRDAEAAMNLTC